MFSLDRFMTPIKSILLLLVICLGCEAKAQLGPEIARQHAQRAGDRLAALVALRVEGRTFINGEIVPFRLLAERPNHLRVESFTSLRRVVQVYDGITPPWFSHTETKGGLPQDMQESEAADFMANADFDGPLVNAAEKGYSVDYAGEELIDGRRCFKLLLLNRRNVIFFLWVDAGSYDIVKRTVYRTSDQQRVAMETRFKDFREIGGVLQPHRIETSANDQLIYVMIIDRMEANPIIPPDSFVRPQI